MAARAAAASGPRPPMLPLLPLLLPHLPHLCLLPSPRAWDRPRPSPPTQPRGCAPRAWGAARLRRRRGGEVSARWRDARGGEGRSQGRAGAGLRATPPHPSRCLGAATGPAGPAATARQAAEQVGRRPRAAPIGARQPQPAAGSLRWIRGGAARGPPDIAGRWWSCRGWPRWRSDAAARAPRGRASAGGPAARYETTPVGPAGPCALGGRVVSMPGGREGRELCGGESLAWTMMAGGRYVPRSTALGQARPDACTRRGRPSAPQSTHRAAPNKRAAGQGRAGSTAGLLPASCADRFARSSCVQAPRTAWAPPGEPRRHRRLLCATCIGPALRRRERRGREGPCRNRNVLTCSRS